MIYRKSKEHAVYKGEAGGTIFQNSRIDEEESSVAPRIRERAECMGNTYCKMDRCGGWTFSFNYINVFKDMKQTQHP